MACSVALRSNVLRHEEGCLRAMVGAALMCSGSRRGQIKSYRLVIGPTHNTPHALANGRSDSGFLKPDCRIKEVTSVQVVGLG